MNTSSTPIPHFYRARKALASAHSRLVSPSTWTQEIPQNFPLLSSSFHSQPPDTTTQSPRKSFHDMRSSNQERILAPLFPFLPFLHFLPQFPSPTPERPRQSACGATPDRPSLSRRQPRSQSPSLDYPNSPKPISGFWPAGCWEPSVFSGGGFR